MKTPAQAKLSRRSLATALLAAAPAVAAQPQQGEAKTPVEDARATYAGHRKSLKAVELDRSTEPAFRFEA